MYICRRRISTDGTQGCVTQREYKERAEVYFQSVFTDEQESN